LAEFPAAPPLAAHLFASPGGFAIYLLARRLRPADIDRDRTGYSIFDHAVGRIVDSMNTVKT